MMNTMVEERFIFLHLTEWEREAEPLVVGSWPHFTHCMPPWFDSYWRRGSAG